MSLYIESFDDFVEETWDYVSPFAVSDDFWDCNDEFIREVTFRVYEIYKKSLVHFDDGTIIEKITVKHCGKLLEAFFGVLNQYHSTIKFPEKETINILIGK